MSGRKWVLWILVAVEPSPYWLALHDFAPSSYFASTQVSDPVTLTATSEMKICSGLPSAVPRCSVEIRRGPAFL